MLNAKPPTLSLYSRAEAQLLRLLPGYITPLRFRIFIGYLIVLLLAIYGWEQITSAWRYLVTLMAPAIALIGAVVALKIGVVIMSLFTLLVALIKFFFSFLMVVLKPGILKAIIVPQVMALVSWIHRKSERLQVFFRQFYQYFKVAADRILGWWGEQQKIDKILLSGFLVPLLIVLVVVFVLERATAIFAVKKLTEQVVQKSTKLVMKNFHKVPVVGSLPTTIATNTRKLTVKKDRADVVDDFKTLGSELYHPEQADSTDQLSK